MSQLRLAAHTLFTVLIGMIQIGKIDADTQNSGNDQYTGCLDPLAYTMLAHSLNQISQSHQQHHRQEIITHLDVVRINLQGGKESRYHSTGNIFAAIA